MRTFLTTLLGVVLVLGLAACQPEQIPPLATSAATSAAVAGVSARAETPTPLPSPTPTPLPSATPTPTDVAVASPSSSGLSVGLVTTADGNIRMRLAHDGLQQAARDLGVQTLEVATQPGDIARNGARLAQAGYNLVIIASDNAPLAAWLAGRYPQTKFVVLGAAPEKPPANLMGVAFAEDQAGFLAGTLAGWITQKDMVGFVGGTPTAEVVKFRKGYEHGVRYVNSKAVVLGKYIYSFTDPQAGAAEAKAQLDTGADVLFAAGGTTAQGAIQETASQGVAVIASEVDPYASGGSVAALLANTVVVRVDKGVREVIQLVQRNGFKAGTITYDVRNGGVELGSYHDWASRVPEAAQKQIAEIFTGLQDGTIKTDVVIPEW